MNKIVFYLMNKKGFYVLSEFLKMFGSENINYVVLAQDKSIKEDYYMEMVNLCKDNYIDCFDRSDSHPFFEGYKFVIGWKWIIEDCNNTIILHDSNLPKYRGYAPIVSMLINKEDSLAVTAIFASNLYDRGDIIQQENIKITYPIKIKDAIDKISPLYFKIVMDIANLIFSDSIINGRIQNEKEATYSLWRDENDYYINWNEESSLIKRKIDALGYPYLGAHTYLNGNLIIIEDVDEYEDVIIENRAVGKVVFMKNGYPVVVCGKGLLKIKNAKYLDGKSILPLKKFRSRFGLISYD